MWWEETPASWKNRERHSHQLHFLFFSKASHVLNSTGNKPHQQVTLALKAPLALPKSLTGTLISRMIKPKHTNVTERQLREEDKALWLKCFLFFSLSDALPRVQFVPQPLRMCTAPNTGQGGKGIIGREAKESFLSVANSRIIDCHSTACVESSWKS